MQVYFSWSVRILYIVSSARLASLGDDFLSNIVFDALQNHPLHEWKIMFCPEDMYIFVVLKKELLKKLMGLS